MAKNAESDLCAVQPKVASIDDEPGLRGLLSVFPEMEITGDRVERNSEPFPGERSPLERRISDKHHMRRGALLTGLCLAICALSAGLWLCAASRGAGGRGGVLDYTVYAPNGSTSLWAL